MLQQLQNTQRVSVREGWLENVVSTVFAVHAEGDMLSESMDAAGDGPKIPDVQKLTGEMEAEMRNDVQDRLNQCKWCRKMF